MNEGSLLLATRSAACNCVGVKRLWFPKALFLTVLTVLVLDRMWAPGQTLVAQQINVNCIVVAWLSCACRAVLKVDYYVYIESASD